MSKFKMGTIFILFAVLYVAYLFFDVNKTVVDNTAAVVNLEIEMAKRYGQLYLNIEGASKENSPKILINGECVSVLTEPKKILDIYDKCVVELDTRGLYMPVILTVEGKSENVITDCVGRSITGNGKIDNVGTFLIDDSY